MSSSGSGNKKSRKSGESDDKDRLGNLPDGVISHILSCLPAKNAIQTCVLSRAWEHKWTSAYCFKIDDRIDEDDEYYPFYEPLETDKGSLISCVYKIFLLSPNIRSFEFLISDDTFHISHLETWLLTLFRLKIENVKLHAPFNPKFPEGIILSRSLLGCTSLRELELILRCTFKVRSKICFPNLTRLYLEDVQFQILNDNSSIDTLVFSFPMLKRLVLRSCRLPKVRFLEIHAPSLDSFIYLKFKDEVHDYVIKILGARLRNFQNWGPFPEKFLLTGNTVQHAYLGVTDHQLTANVGLRSRSLLNEFSILRKLKLSCAVAKAIAETKSGLPIPMYDKLGKLKLSGYVRSGHEYSANVEAMFLLLHAAPFLDYLVIDIAISGINSGDQETYEQVEDGYDYVAVESVSVPSCLSQLKKVKFKRLDNNPHQFNLVRFLLKNCPQLEEFRFNCYGIGMNIDELRRKLSSFPRAPKAPTKRVAFIMPWKV